MGLVSFRTVMRISHLKYLIVFAAFACTSAEVQPHTAALNDPPRLLAMAEMPRAGLDDAPLSRVGFVDGQGTIREHDQRALLFVERFRDGAALVDPERRLYQVWPLERRMLATNVSALASDGERLVYVRDGGDGLSIRLHDGASERVLARGLASAGVLKLEAERVLFVGAANGGVAGIWQASVHGAEASCVTNCDLRAGQPWGDAFVPPPTDPELLEAP